MTPLEGSAVLIAFLVAALASIRWKVRADQKAFLSKPFPVEAHLTPKIGLVEAAPPALSTFDVLYNMSKIDPHCLRGVEHLHHAQHFANLGDLMHYLKTSILREHLDGAAWRSVIHKYKGYTGEEVEFDHLQAAGHHVERAASATEPGHDAVVDGHLNNIKVTDNPSYISEHLQQHPDVDVITNTEMSAAFPNDPHVQIDPALSSQDAFHSTADTFTGVHDLGSLFHHIPLITLVLSSARNTRNAFAGRKSAVDALAHTVVDTASVGMGGFAGAKLGLLVGLALAPATGGLSAVIATAGCTLAGSVGGVLAGRSVGSWFKSRHLRELLRVLEADAVHLRNAFERCVDDIIATFRRARNQQIEIYRASQKRLQNWVARAVAPSTMTTFYSMACSHTKAEFAEWRHFYRLINEESSAKQSASEAGLYVYSYGREVYACSETVLSAWDGVHNSLVAVEKERLRIS